jgi:uncharacterized protein (DUF924 family)
MSKLDHYIPSEVLNFWFSNENKEKWFIKNKIFDKLIKDKFLALYEKAAAGMLVAWTHTPEGILALILILDQFPRNMFREHAKSFATDHQALMLAKEAIKKGIDKKLPALYQKFIYMPFMHSENLEDQQLSVQLFKNDTLSYQYTVRHMEIIKNFGRFPHRNEVLGRKSTDAELEFLKTPTAYF